MPLYPTAQINQVGLQINAIQPVGGLSFVAANVFLLITDFNGIETTYNAFVDPTGTFASYITNGTEFNAGIGVYSIQLQLERDGKVFFSPVTNLKIQANLI